jgi:Flp pilus assembly protein TadD
VPKWSYPLVFFLAVGAYLNTIDNEFVFDDSRLVVNNKDVRGFDLVAIFSHDVGGLPKGHPKNVGSYRPFTILSYAINFRLCGMRAGGFHFVDIILHGCCSLLSLLVCRRILESSNWAIVVAGLFALHPVHTEAVANITGRSEILAACFFFLGLLAHINYRTSGKRLYLAALAACYLCAIFSKESAITLLWVVILYDFVFDFGEWGSIRRSRKLDIYAPIVCLAAVAFACVLLRSLAVGGLTRVPYTEVENPMAFAPFQERWLTRFYLLTEYTRLLVLPFSLSADYSFNQIPLLSIKDPRNLFTVFILAAYFGLLYWNMERANALFFALAFIAATFCITANILIPIGTLIGERLLYLPSFGYCLALGCAGQYARSTWNGPTARKVMIGLVISVSVLFAARTFTRNEDWRTNLSLFESAEKVSPNSVKVNYNLGHIYARKGRLKEAEDKYKRALEIKPDFNLAWVGLSGVYAFQGRTGDLKNLYSDAISKRVYDVEIPLNYANALMQVKKWKQAGELYESALSFDPENSKTMMNLGVCYERLGDKDEAAKNYRKAMEIDPNEANPAYNLLLLFIRQNQLDEAHQLLNEIPEKLKRDEKMLKARYELVVKLVNDAKDFSKAADNVEYILKRNPAFPNADVMQEDLMRWRKEGH